MYWHESLLGSGEVWLGPKPINCPWEGMGTNWSLAIKWLREFLALLWILFFLHPCVNWLFYFFYHRHAMNLSYGFALRGYGVPTILSRTYLACLLSCYLQTIQIQTKTKATLSDVRNTGNSLHVIVLLRNEDSFKLKVIFIEDTNVTSQWFTAGSSELRLKTS